MTITKQEFAVRFKESMQPLIEFCREMDTELEDEDADVYKDPEFGYLAGQTSAVLLITTDILENLEDV